MQNHPGTGPCCASVPAAACHDRWISPTWETDPFQEFRSIGRRLTDPPGPHGGSEQSGATNEGRTICKESIFHYIYGVLHDPVFRETYAANLKRELPRIPFYSGFWQWADWGKALMDLHIGYEQVTPFLLVRTDVPDEKARRAHQSPKALLRANREAGSISLDSETTLTGIPPEAWDYKLGNRSALEWVLDQYKEKKPRDPTIREKFNTYRFADYKDKVIDLLGRVTTVSMETVKIVEQMRRTASR